jgi:hypothetical protein
MTVEIFSCSAVRRDGELQYSYLISRKHFVCFLVMEINVRRNYSSCIKVRDTNR